MVGLQTKSIRDYFWRPTAQPVIPQKRAAESPHSSPKTSDSAPTISKPQHSSQGQSLSSDQTVRSSLSRHEKSASNDGIVRDSSATKTPSSAPSPVQKKSSMPGKDPDSGRGRQPVQTQASPSVICPREGLGRAAPPSSDEDSKMSRENSRSVKHHTENANGHMIACRRDTIGVKSLEDIRGIRRSSSSRGNSGSDKSPSEEMAEHSKTFRKTPSAVRSASPRGYSNTVKSLPNSIQDRSELVRERSVKSMSNDPQKHTESVLETSDAVKILPEDISRQESPSDASPKPSQGLINPDPELPKFSRLPKRSTRSTNSVKVIENSEEDESDDGLQDLDTLMGTAPKSDPYPGFYQSPEKRRQQYKPYKPLISLQLLAKQRQDFESTKETIARFHTVIDRQTTGASEPRLDTLDAVFQNGITPEADRLRAAIERTETVFFDETWALFEIEHRRPAPSLPPIPKLEPALSQLLDESMRQHTFLSGVLIDLARYEPLPQDLLSWLLESLTCEKSENLRCAYHDALAASAESLSVLLTPERFDGLLHQCGAEESALNVEMPALTRRTVEKAPRYDRVWDVEAIARLMAALSSHLSIETRIHAISIFCRMLLDVGLIQNRSLLMTIEGGLVQLLHFPSEETPESILNYQESILHRLYLLTTAPYLRLQLLNQLPVSTSRWQYLRHRLVLAFIFDTPAYLELNNPLPLYFSDVLSILSTRPVFQISPQTDYTLLVAMISMLDMAINSATLVAPEDNFNVAVDDVVHQIKIMSSKIVDAGISNLRRTEAKEMLEALQIRLLHVIRTQPPRKKLIFGGETDSEQIQGMVKGMSAFLSKTNRTLAAA